MRRARDGRAGGAGRSGAGGAGGAPVDGLLEGLDLVFRYPGAEVDAVRGVSVRAEPGRLSTILGPNGSGKSTLLRLVAGGLRPASGTARFAGRRLARWSRRDLAREVAVVTQREHIPFPVTVRALVAMGRYPHLGPWRREGEADRAAIGAAMERCGVAGLGERAFQTLSGGERQRVRVARALAQEPRALVLDEPTAALDMRYEMTIFRLLRELAHRDGVAVLLVTHNLNLAARFGDRHLLLDGGRTAAQGDAAAVLTTDNISGVYGWPVSVAMGVFGEGRAPQVVPE